MMRGAVGVVICGLLFSCGGGGGATTGSGGSGAAGSSGYCNNSGGNSGTNGQITARVANTFLTSGTKSGPAVDIYDDMYNNCQVQPSETGTPLIANLRYGTMSGYVKPRFVDADGGAVHLVALPAGSPSTDTKDAWAFWGGIDDGSHPQITLLLVNQGSSGSGPLAGFEYSVFYEKGEAPYSAIDRAPLAPPPPSGQGEYLVNTEAINTVTQGGPGSYFFFVDDSCTPPLNPNPNFPGLPYVNTVGPVSPGDFSQFAETPSTTHQISIVGWNGSAPPACSSLLGSKQGTTTVGVAAGQQIITFIYGSSSTDLHLLAGPIAP
jgi:hypothetical protein